MFRNPLTDLIVVLVVVLLIFGPKRLPLLGRSLGQGMREFKESITGESKIDEDLPELERSTSAQAPVPVEPVPTAQRTSDVSGQDAESVPAAPSERRP